MLAGATSTPSRTEPAHTPRSRSAAAEYTCSDVWPVATLNGNAFGLPVQGSVSSMPIWTCAAAGNANATASKSATTDRGRGGRGMVEEGGTARAGGRIPARARSGRPPAQTGLRRTRDGQLPTVHSSPFDVATPSALPAVKAAAWVVKSAPSRSGFAGMPIGKVAVAPSNASFQDFVAALNQLVGKEKADAWLKGMAANGAKAYAKNGAIVEAVTRGEIPMGLVNHYYVLEAKEDDPNAPVAAHRFPGTDPGSLFLVATASVPEATPDKAQADGLVKFLLSDTAQELIVAGEGEYPTVPGVKAAEGAPSLAESDYPAYDLSNQADLKAIATQIRESGLAG